MVDAFCAVGPIDRDRLERLADGLAVRLRVSHAAEGARIRMQLEPRELGEVIVRLEIQHGVAHAHLIAESADARKRLGTAPSDERARLVRVAAQRPYLLIYRTLADPRYLDPTLDPSERPLGSIFSFGRDPIVGNYGEGLARAMTARGWLSTWSGLASNAALERTLPDVALPTLVVAAEADTDIYPAECRRAFEASAARDKAYVALADADHYLRPANGVAGDPQKRAAEEVILPWLRERWPV